jgi:hypothetical protein
MADPGDFELFTGPAPSEKKEMSDEKFQEEMKATQAAIAQLQKEEGKAKKNDNNLAAIIVQFLSQPQNTDLFLLVSRTVAQNIPSELIIAVLSLIDKKAQEEVAGLLKAGQSEERAGGEEPKVSLVIHKKANFETLSPQNKKEIDVWISHMARVAAAKPHRTLESLVIPGPQRELSQVLIQLSAFILRRYLTDQQIDIEFADLRDFMQEVFVDIVKNLEKLVSEQKQIEQK